MPNVLVPIAEGCEELEAVTIIDLLRRAEIDVTTAGLDEKPVRASRGTVLVPDTSLDEALESSYDMIVLPGGLPGADHLNDDPRIISTLKEMAKEDKFTAAICAAPKVLGGAGLLDGKTATGYPGAIDAAQLPRTELTGAPVEVDGKVITSRGPGTAMDFALELITQLSGSEVRDRVEAELQRP